MKSEEIYHFRVDIKKVSSKMDVDDDSKKESRGGSRQGQESQRELPSKICRHAMVQLAKDCGWRPGTWAFDGRNSMYSPSRKLVPETELQRDVKVVLPDEEKSTHFNVTIKHVNTLQFDTGGRSADYVLRHEFLQALDVVLKHNVAIRSASSPYILAQGRSFLIFDRGDRNIGGGARVWLGYKQAVRPCQTGLALTIDTAAGAIWNSDPERPTSLDEMMWMLIGGRRDSQISHRQISTLQKSLRGLKIRTKHNGFTRTIVGLASKTPFEERFTDASGSEVTIAQYFDKQYKFRLSDRTLPCVRVGNGRVLLPPEACLVVPKQRFGKLSGDQTAGMIRHAAQRPDAKMQDLADKAKQISQDASKEMGSFHVEMKTEMMRVEGRTLPTPTLKYGGRDQNFSPQAGSWNLKGITFAKGETVKSWSILSLTTKPWEQQGMDRFADELAISLKECGMHADRRPPIIFGDPNRDNIQTRLQQAAEKADQHFRRKAQILIVVLPDNGTALYQEIKRASDSTLGIPTQCLVGGKAGIGDQRGPKKQYLANVAMKINSKLGGVNVSLSSQNSGKVPFIHSFSSKPFIIFGADVTHPGLGSSGPSVAAVVASLDSTATKYASRVSAQPSTDKKQVQEIIFDLKTMAKELFQDFYNATGGKKPERIIFYRDGVSEGQFNDVLEYEYRALREACQEMGDGSSGYAPPITFVIVQKRHQTRIFAQDRRDTDRSGNVKPGVVIDTRICHPREFDFYLSSHAGLQGTIRPTHYHCLVDENRLTADELQLLTYHFCYTFCRCTRSISVPPAARYAHLAAFRARCMLTGGDSESGSVVSGYSDSPGQETLMPINRTLDSVMYYV